MQSYQNDANYIVVVSVLLTVRKPYSLFAPYSGVSIVVLEQKLEQIMAGLGKVFVFFQKNKNYFVMKL